MPSRDWFAAFAPDESGQHQNTGQPWATGATTAGNPQKPWDFEVAPIERGVGNHWATAETKENHAFQELVAPVALVAHENKEVRTAPGWDAADWRAYFDERAGIAEHDGGLSRADAEDRAYQVCVSQWMNRHAPRPTDPEGRCAHCDEPMPESDALPFLTRGGHVWLHSRCHAPWIARLRAEAVTALAGYGVALQPGKLAN